MEDTKLEIINKGLKGVCFKIGTSEKLIESTKTMLDIITHLQSIRDYIEHYQHKVNYYKDYESRIDDILNEMENDFDAEDKNFMVGENFSDLTRYLDDGEFKNMDNNSADKILKPMYEAEFGKSKLIFDAEYSFCYITTTSRKEAKQFLLFTYRNIFKPALAKILE